MTNITLNNLSLTSGSISVSSITHDSAPENILNFGQIPRRDRAKLVSSEYSPKKIVIEGTITGDSQDDMETNLDNFKKSVYKTEINLDISYETSTRRYVVSPASIVITRAANNVTFAGFAIELVAVDPAGQATSTISQSWTSIDNGTYKATFTAVGTMYPEPQLSFLVNSCFTFSELSIQNSYRNDTLTIPGLFSAGDTIIADIGARKVSRNTIEHEYSGVFPEFTTDNNIITLGLTADSCNIDMTLTYIPRYL